MQTHLPRRETLRRIAGVALGVAAASGCAIVPRSAPARLLRAAPAAQALGAARPTAIWAFDGTAPGPLLRYRQGDAVDIEVINDLPAPTTVHWHGVRVPHAMDGVPHVTQAPIAPGARFRYRFRLEDAGTFWYHPHFRSHEQVSRGLYGALIVDEREPPAIDHDWTWVLADWLLDPAGAIRTDFDDPRDMSHAGRIGNLLTLDGRPAMHREADPAPIAVGAGARIRLRLINAASARIIVLDFGGASPIAIAYDGQPVAPHTLVNDRLILGPGMRTDLLVDMPAGRVTIRDRTDPRRIVIVRELAGTGLARAREPFRGLAPNPLAEPDLARATRHELVLEGGARGRLREARVGDKTVPIDVMMREHGMAWAMNGVAAGDHAHAPFATFRRGASAIVAIINRTEWPHPMHLHGHAFRVLATNGRPSAHREWRDTAIVNANERIDIAFLADNPGDWMFHCHILQHQQGGMMGSIRVLD